MSKQIVQTWQNDPRHQKILEILQDGKPHKAGEIAYAVGVHSRTVRRVLHRLRDEAELPIEADLKGFVLRN